MTETEQKPVRTKPDAVSEATASVAATDVIDDGRKDYRITKLAGPRVAGQLHNGKTIRLSEHEALAELLDGTIELAAKAG